MSAFLTKPCTAFDDQRLLSAGPLIEVALAVKNAIEDGAAGTVLTFDDATGAIIDLDLRGSKTDIIARLSERAVDVPAQPGSAPDSSAADVVDTSSGPRGRGRPRLGVVAREVTLLPRHWEWLASQPGGASVILRRLVDEARRANGGQSQARARQAVAYRFMSALAGDLPGFEEATRALFAGNHKSFERQMAAWPIDLRTYALKLASDAGTQEPL